MAEPPQYKAGPKTRQLVASCLELTPSSPALRAKLLENLLWLRERRADIVLNPDTRQILDLAYQHYDREGDLPSIQGLSATIGDDVAGFGSRAELETLGSVYGGHGLPLEQAQLTTGNFRSLYGQCLEYDTGIRFSVLCKEAGDIQRRRGIPAALEHLASQGAKLSTQAKPAPERVHILTADEVFAADDPSELVIPALGICPGPPFEIVAPSWVGKTWLAMTLGLSVAATAWFTAGEPPLALGQWEVSGGPWLHLDYEMGKRHVKRRIRRLARGLAIPDEVLRSMLSAGFVRLAVYPDLDLTDPQAIPEFTALFTGVRLVTCDSLRPMLGRVDENSSQVRPLVQVLTRASERSRAACILIHHAGNPPSRDQGPRARGDSGRGSSAIKQEVAGMLVVSKAKEDAAARVTHEKDRELGSTVEDFGYVLEDVQDPDDEQDPKWGLRVRYLGKDDLEQAGRQHATMAMETALRKLLPFTGTRAQLLKTVGGNQGIASMALTNLLDTRITRTGRGADCQYTWNDEADLGAI